MKILAAISSCQSFEDSGLNTPQRETWIPIAESLGITCVFFHGNGAKEKQNVVVLPVDDGMGGLTEKAKAKAKFAHDYGYDYMFSCFPDTYLCPGRLLGSGFEFFDYLGNVYQHPGGAPYCQGGPGYVLSRNAMKALYQESSSYLNDDCWIGDVLQKSNLRRGHSDRFSNLGPGPLRANEAITNHLSTQPGGYVGTNMHAEHRRWIDSWL